MKVYIIIAKFTEGRSKHQRKEFCGVFSSKEGAKNHMAMCVSKFYHLFNANSRVVFDSFAIVEYNDCGKKKKVIYEIEEQELCK